MERETQNKLWDLLSKEEDRDFIVQRYIDTLDDCGESSIIAERELLEDIFGKHNLAAPTIKTWGDIESSKILKITNWEDSDIGFIALDKFKMHSYDQKIINKAIATLKIHKLIELGYGGIPKDGDIAYTICINENNKKDYIISATTTDSCFIKFKAKELAEKFISYPENVLLIADYFMF